MRDAVELEVGAVAALAQAAALDLSQAQGLLDASGVQAQDFAEREVAAIWGVVDAMIRDGRTPEFFAVEAKLPKANRKLLERILLQETRGSAKERLRVVRDSGQRRRAARALETVRALVLDTSRPLTEASAEAHKALESIRQTDTTAATLDAEVLAFCDHLDEVAQGRREPVLPTGIEALDAVIGGLQPTLTIIGALPGVGKSGLLAAIVRNLAGRGERVGFFSLEDERGWLVRRLAAEASGVPLFVLQNKPLTKAQQERVATATEKLYRDMAHVVVDDRSGLTTADIVASARDMIVRHRVRALLVDHLGEIRLQRSDRHDLDIADALSQLRALAKTYRVPVVVACHLRRREGLSITDEPRLTDFAFSAAVERMARVGLALSKPNEDTLKVHVLKQTNGRAHVAVDLAFTGPAGVVANEAAPGVSAKVAALYAEQEGA